MVKNKYAKLGLSVLFDAIGMASFVIPGVGEFSDVVWAPVAALLMTKMYKGNVGKAGAVFAFIEEAAPGLDVIPTFTIMWVYNYVFKKNETEADENVIEVDPS